MLERFRVHIAIGRVQRYVDQLEAESMVSHYKNYNKSPGRRGGFRKYKSVHQSAEIRRASVRQRDRQGDIKNSEQRGANSLRAHETGLHPFLLRMDRHRYQSDERAAMDVEYNHDERPVRVSILDQRSDLHHDHTTRLGHRRVVQHLHPQLEELHFKMDHSGDAIQYSFVQITSIVQQCENKIEGKG